MCGTRVSECLRLEMLIEQGVGEGISPPSSYVASEESRNECNIDCFRLRPLKWARMTKDKCRTIPHVNTDVELRERE